MDEETQVRPFADFLLEINGGDTHDELSEALRDVTKQVNETGRAGTVTFTLKIKPAGRNSYGNVMITDEVTVKLPKVDRAETVWFVSPDGNVSRDNPSQPRLPLREVPRPGLAADPETGEVSSNG